MRKIKTGILSHYCIIFGFGILLCSCTQPEQEPSSAEKSSAEWSNLKALNVAIYGNIWGDIRSNLSFPPLGNHENEINKQIQWWRSNPDELRNTLSNSAPYIYYIYQQTQEKHLPPELALLPIPESGYNPFEYSRVGATGLWQIMPTTASGYGLKIDWWYDGRRDVVASTPVALRYLSYLHDYFNNDWLLAIAAYNSGEGKVQSAIRSNQRQGKDTDFWSLKLPQQTHTYVCRFLALIEIIRDPKRYDLTLPAISDEPFVKQVDIGTQIDIKQAAKMADISESVLRKLNPGLRRFATDPNGPYSLLLPKSNADEFIKNLENKTNPETIVWQEHVIKNGDSLEKLAAKNHISTQLLAKANNLHSNILKPGQTIVIPSVSKQLALKNEEKANKGPTPDKAEADNDSENNGKKSLTETEDTADKTTVLADDEENAGNYSDAESFQPLPNKILEKQLLTEKIAEINAFNQTSESKKNSITEEKIPGRRQINHTVVAGESLASIARHYRIDVDELAFWNQLDKKAQLRPGEEIVIWLHPENIRNTIAKYRIYTVAQGDSISSIAHRYKISTKKMLQINKLDGDTLKPGQHLKIPV